jgi:prephenate dehydratase
VDKVTEQLIAYQGEAGANSHIACQQVYPNWQTLPCPTFEDAFAAIIDGRAQLGMIPVENSLNGRVADIHHFLPQAGLHIIGEFFLPIHFHLLALPGVKIEQLKSVYSHIHALGQCRNIIRAHNLKPVITGDTAGSAREVAEWKDPTRASLAPALAGEIYGLKSLAANVEDSAHNTTRFLILAREPHWPDVNAGPCVTTFVFRVRNVPAALYKALGGFATNSVNLTKLESYMVEGEFAATQFLVDVDGHPDQPSMRHALEELDFFSREVKILGVYPAHPFRSHSA